MTREEAKSAILTALRRATKDDSLEIEYDIDLLAKEVIDSLDGMVFLLELSGLTGVDFPETDPKEMGLFKVPTLIEFLTKS